MRNARWRIRMWYVRTPARLLILVDARRAYSSVWKREEMLRTSIGEEGNTAPERHRSERDEGISFTVDTATQTLHRNYSLEFLL